MNIIKAITLGALGLLALAAPAGANEPALKSQITVESDVVTLGDLFDHAGDKASIAVFRAPALGQTGTIQAERVASAAAGHGLYWQPEGYVAPVSVTRAAREITPAEIARAIEAHLIARHGGEAYEVVLPPRIESLFIEATAKAPLEVAGMMELYGGRVRATLNVPDSQMMAAYSAIEGTAYEMVHVVEAARSVARGSIIGPSDVALTLQRKDRAGLAPATQLSEVVGKATRTTLAAQRTVRLADVEEPRIIERGKAVLMVFLRPGLTLTARGQALEDGAEGDLVKVMNPQSNRILQGVVASDGRIIVNGQIDLAENNQTPEAR